MTDGRGVGDTSFRGPAMLHGGTPPRDLPQISKDEPQDVSDLSVQDHRSHGIRIGLGADQLRHHRFL